MCHPFNQLHPPPLFTPLPPCPCWDSAELDKGPFIPVGQGEEISFRSKNRGSKSRDGDHRAAHLELLQGFLPLAKKTPTFLPLCYKDHGASALLLLLTPTRISITAKKKTTHKHTHTPHTGPGEETGTNGREQTLITNTSDVSQTDRRTDADVLLFCSHTLPLTRFHSLRSQIHALSFPTLQQHTCRVSVDHFLFTSDLTLSPRNFKTKERRKKTKRERGGGKKGKRMKEN